MPIREGKSTVIKSRIFPVSWGGMANDAICAKVTIMGIILLVAGITIGRSAFEDTVQMTGLALDFGMAAFQFECEQIMVKIRIIPISWGMTEFTTLAIFSIVFIFS